MILPENIFFSGIRSCLYKKDEVKFSLVESSFSGKNHSFAKNISIVRGKLSGINEVFKT